MRNLILLLCLLPTTFYIAQAEDNSYFNALYNMPLTIQTGYGFSEEPLRLAVDQNITINWLNAGVRYDMAYQWDASLGIGAGSLLQLQYGYSITNSHSLIRLRSDFPIATFTSQSGIWHDITIGIYADHAFDSELRDASFGLSIGYDIPLLLSIASD